MQIAVQLNSTFEVQDLMDIAEVQRTTVMKLKEEKCWKAEWGINKTLLDCSMLFNEYAMKYELYGIQILLYAITKFNNLEIIKQSWAGLIQKEPISEVVQLIKHVYPSFNCPIQWIVKELLNKYKEERVVILNCKEALNQQVMMDIWSQMGKSVENISKYY